MAATAAQISWTSAKVGARGFSHNSALPDARVASTSSRCVDVGDVIMTASMAGSSITSPGIGGQVLEGAVSGRGRSRRLCRVSGAHGHDLAVLGHHAESVGVDLADHPAADEPDPQRSALGHSLIRSRASCGVVTSAATDGPRCRRACGARAGPAPHPPA